jgi:hypothetical protein
MADGDHFFDAPDGSEPGDEKAPIDGVATF